MRDFEVPEPILNSPFEEPAAHWRLIEGEPPVKEPGRRAAMYFYRPPERNQGEEPAEEAGTAIELALVNLIRQRVKEWREKGYPGVTRTTLELLHYWRREGRQHRLFFAQLEAAETVIFLVESRADFRQGLDIPRDEPSDERQAEGMAAFTRYACKMATGAGKTTVMGMLAAWSILNKVNDRSDGRFSDAVLVVCPNVTIRTRLGELYPDAGEASLYRTRDLVPPQLMADLSQGRVFVTNWHVFEPQSVQVGGVSSKVSRAGKPVRVIEKIAIGHKTTTARGTRYLTLEDFEQQVTAGILTVLAEDRDKQGNLKAVKVESWKYVESDRAVVARVLGRELGRKENILVFNDEAHHAYRIRRKAEETIEEIEADDALEADEIEEAEVFVKEATVWVDGLDRIHKHRGINLCMDFSATPFFLQRVSTEVNRPFPWVVSDFGLTDAIESGLVKIPQLAVRDTTGAEIPGYFNIWRWILPQLTTAERGGKRGSVKPEAVLKWGHHPIAMLAGLWEDLRIEWEKTKDDPRPPVFILVCKNTRIAKLAYEWLALNEAPPGVPPSGIAGFLNRDGEENTIRVDSRVVEETDTGEAKGDESRWMRLTLDTVGKTSWPLDRQGRPIYPEGFEDLARKLGRSLDPPGRRVRCIVSVGMLTEGWDCNTVTHIIGLRPFMSQLLCEQVVGRGLRRTNYEVGPDGRLTEEVAKILGVPFEVIPFKENKDGPKPPKSARTHVFAVPAKDRFEIRFPRVEGYMQAVRYRLFVDWDAIAPLRLDPKIIPPEVEMKAHLPLNANRPTLSGPGRIAEANLRSFLGARRTQELVFELACDLTREFSGRDPDTAPAHVLFPQLRAIVDRYLSEKVKPIPPAVRKEAFLAPYYGWMIERLLEAIRPDPSQGEAPELPRYERFRRTGSTADVDFWTSRPVQEIEKSHVNYVVADTQIWEQAAAVIIDKHPAVETFVKNAGLAFTIPYMHNGQAHDYVPDFIIKLDGSKAEYLIIETKGFDPMEDIKTQAAQRWVAAVNAEGSFGTWRYAVAHAVEEVGGIINAAIADSTLPAG